MLPIMSRLLPAVVITLTVAGGWSSRLELRGADWPRLGGPGGTGVSRETGLTRTWPTGGPHVLWTLDVAEGFAGPAVAGGQVFLLDRPDARQDVLRCLDLLTGREEWRLAYDAPGTLPYNGSRNVPTIDERFIFTVSAFGLLHCIDRQTHRVVWARHLIEDFKDPRIDTAGPPVTRADLLARAQVPTWGLTQAPLLYRDTVIVGPQTQNTGLVAYEKATGKLRWRSGYIGRNWYSHVSPCLATLGNVDQVLMLAQPSDPEKAPENAPPAIISSLDPATGQMLWTNNTPGPHKIPIPQPLPLDDKRVLITGGYGLGCVIVQVNQRAGQWECKVLSRTKVAATHIHSPVLYGDRVYLTSFKEHGAAATGLVCLDLEGHLLWQTGPELQFDFGSFLIADGMAYVLHGKTGVLHLFELSTSGPKLLAKAKVLEARNAKAWAPLALSDGKLLVRDQHQMKCLDVRAN